MRLIDAPSRARALGLAGLVIWVAACGGGDSHHETPDAGADASIDAPAVTDGIAQARISAYDINRNLATQTDGNGNTSPFSSSRLVGTLPTSTPTSTPTTTPTLTPSSTATATATSTATATQTATATSTPTTGPGVQPGKDIYLPIVRRGVNNDLTLNP